MFERLRERLRRASSSPVVLLGLVTLASAVTATVFTLSLLTILLALAWVSGSSESPRLWLYMVPLLALVVAGGIFRRHPRELERRALWLCASQAALTVIMKVSQPW